jgi:hypothetical protein
MSVASCEESEGGTSAPSPFLDPDGTIVGNRAKWEYENALDCRLQVRA